MSNNLAVPICVACGKPAIGQCEATSSIYHRVDDAARLPAPTPSPAADEAGCLEAVRSVIEKYFGDDAVACDMPMTACARAILPLIRAEVARERAECERVARHPGFIQARDTAWDEGVNYAKRFIGDSIRDRAKTENE